MPRAGGGVRGRVDRALVVLRVHVNDPRATRCEPAARAACEATLVLESIGFSDETWLGRGGFFHSDQMRVVEKFTRTGNQMLYEVTVEDPVVLAKPWVMPSRTLRLSNGNTIIAERGSCTESELAQVTSQMRH